MQRLSQSIRAANENYLRLWSPWRPNQRLIFTFHCKGIFFSFDSVLAFTHPLSKYCSQNVWFRFAVILQDMNLSLTPFDSFTLVGPDRMHLNCNFVDDRVRLKLAILLSSPSDKLWHNQHLLDLRWEMILTRESAHIFQGRIGVDGSKESHEVTG